MKKLFVTLLCALLLPVAALCETMFAGEVTAGQTQVIVAPYGGIVQGVAVRVGDSVKIGDTIASIGTTKVYAMTEGTISGVFASEGDAAADIKERYGALCYIEPINRYTLDASTEKAYNSSENRYIHIGETVFLSCTKDGTHQGRGVITAIDKEDEDKYTVEVTGGEFYMGETVAIYRDEAYTNESRIGRGTVERTPPVAVNAEGSVLRLHVKAGDSVERGELLLETVSGTLDGLYAPETKVVSDCKGVIATVDAGNGTAVEKGAKIATIYPEDAMQVSMVISESDLMDVKVGGKASIEFNWDADGERRFDGVISAISYVNEKKQEGGSSAAEYDAIRMQGEPPRTGKSGISGKKSRECFVLSVNQAKSSRSCAMGV